MWKGECQPFRTPWVRTSFISGVVSPPKDQDAHARFASRVQVAKTSYDAEANNIVRYVRRRYFEGWLDDSGNPEHTQKHHNATTTHNRPWQLRRARVKRQLLCNWPRRLQHHCEMQSFGVVVRAGAKWRSSLEKTSGEKQPCPNLCLRS